MFHVNHGQSGRPRKPKWYISFATLGELTTWTVLRSWGPRKLADLTDWRRGVVVLPSDETMATAWGHLQARGLTSWSPTPGERHVDRALRSGQPASLGHL